MRVLIIDKEARDKIAAALKAAQKHPGLLTDIIKSEASTPKVGRIEQSFKRDPRHDPPVAHIDLKHGYHAVFGIEQQPSGFFKHLSVSIDVKGRLPMWEAILMIAKEFGMEAEDIATGWVEEFEPGRYAVNVVTPTGEQKAGHA